MRALQRVSGCLLVVATVVAGGCKGERVGGEAAPVPFEGALVEGVVADGDHTAAGVTVELYADAETAFREQPAFSTGPTLADGAFRFEVPAGTYYLVARRFAQQNHFAFFGGNPIILGPGGEFRAIVRLWPMRLPVAAELPPPPVDVTGVRGSVMAPSGPLADAIVVAYADAKTTFWGPGAGQVATDANGQFLLPLEPGRYFLVARKKSDPAPDAPFAIGDQYAFYWDNPVQVPRNGFIDIAMSSIGRPADVPNVSEEPPLIEGRVLDRYGNPVSNIYVGADPLAANLDSPSYLSELTGVDGRFRLELPDAGRYFLSARSRELGPSQRGDLRGYYTGTSDHTIFADAGRTVGGVELVVTKVR